MIGNVLPRRRRRRNDRRQKKRNRIKAFDGNEREKIQCKITYATVN